MKHYTDQGLLHESKLSGKMKGIPSISTSPMLNQNCEKNRQIKGSICQSCYAVAGCKMYPSLDKVLNDNSDLLQNILDISSVKTTTLFFRFESHGDLINENHLLNYVNIAKNNPQTKFALWTKVIPIAEEFFNKVKKPENFQLIYSSIMKNKKINARNLKHMDKIFSVYTKDYIAENNTAINCGSRSCSTCQVCYTGTGEFEINERLK